MIAPVLPGAENLMKFLSGTVDYILVDRMNYHYADLIYLKYRLGEKLADEYFTSVSQNIRAECDRLGIQCSIVF
jgi:hypothetical protein